MNAYLQCPTGSAIVLAGPYVTLGRDTGCEIVLPYEDMSLSRRHAQLQCHGSQWWLSDLGSSNGTCVNGVLVTGPRALVDGDRLRLGNTELTFRCPPAVVAPPVAPSSRGQTVGLPPSTAAPPPAPVNPAPLPERPPAQAEVSWRPTGVPIAAPVAWQAPRLQEVASFAASVKASAAALDPDLAQTLRWRLPLALAAVSVGAMLLALLLPVVVVDIPMVASGALNYPQLLELLARLMSSELGQLAIEWGQVDLGAVMVYALAAPATVLLGLLAVLFMRWLPFLPIPVGVFGWMLTSMAASQLRQVGGMGVEADLSFVLGPGFGLFALASIALAVAGIWATIAALVLPRPAAMADGYAGAAGGREA